MPNQATEDMFTDDIAGSLFDSVLSSVNLERYELKDVVYLVLTQDKETGKMYLTTGSCSEMDKNYLAQVLDLAKEQIQ